MKTPARGYQARRKVLGLSPAWITVVVLLVVFGGLWIGGVIDPIHLFFGPRPPSHRGEIAIPVSGTNIPAYTRLTRDHLWNPQAKTFAVIWLRPEQVSPDMKRNLGDIVGRVLNHDKAGNYVFTEADFLPPGTRPGLVAGIPPGKRAMRVDTSRIPGLIGLVPGDRFDLVSTLPLEPGGAGTALAAGGLYGRQLDLQARLTNWQKQATVRVVVQNGNIVQPMTTRQIPVANNSLTQGLIVRTRPVQEVIIAVAPGEVARLTEAMAVGAEISCVPRSGNPADPHDSVTPELYPVSPFGGTVARPTATASVAVPGEPSDPNIPGSTPISPLGPNLFGAGFSQIESISGNKREIIATPVKR